MAFHLVHPEDRDAAQQCQQLLEALPGVLDKADLEVRYLLLINLRENRLEASRPWSTCSPEPLSGVPPIASFAWRKPWGRLSA